MSTYALTGELASGKSTILRLFKEKGAVIFNADELVHGYYKNNTSSVYRRIQRAFPQVIEGKEISRKKLAEIVFTKKNALCDLERIVHPVIIRDLKIWVKNADREHVYIAEVPLLFEKKLEHLFDKIIVVRVTHRVLSKRIQTKLRFSRAHARVRLSLYVPLQDKLKKADHVISNDSTLRVLKKEVSLLWNSIKVGKGKR